MANSIESKLKNGKETKIYRFESIKDFNVLTGKNGCGKSKILGDIYYSLGYILQKMNIPVIDEYSIINIPVKFEFENTKHDCSNFLKLNEVHGSSVNNSVTNPDFDKNVNEFKIELKQICFPIIYDFNANSLEVTQFDNSHCIKNNSRDTITFKFFKSIESIIKYLVIREANHNYEYDERVKDNGIEIFTKNLNDLNVKLNNFLADNNFEHKIYFSLNNPVRNAYAGFTFAINQNDFSKLFSGAIDTIGENDLSSGERSIFLSLLWKYLHKEGVKLDSTYKCVILLDEPDSHLNQSAIENFMFNIENIW